MRIYRFSSSWGEEGAYLEQPTLLQNCMLCRQNCPVAGALDVEAAVGAAVEAAVVVAVEAALDLP